MFTYCSILSLSISALISDKPWFLQRALECVILVYSSSSYLILAEAFEFRLWIPAFAALSTIKE